MRKTYMMLLALMLSVLGTTAASAQKIYQAELDKSMFKAWTDHQPGASVVEEPEAIDDGAATFNCEANFFKELSAGSVVFGNTNVYYLWYADLTGTKTMAFKGTAGLQLRVLMNRPEPNGGDAHGGTTVEKTLTIGDNGEATLDLSDLEYVHLNCIKLGWGSPVGVIKEIVLTGTVKPASGLLSMINNGDAEGTDLNSFPVSHFGGIKQEDDPVNYDTGAASFLPEIIEGGVGGGHCFKVTNDPNPVQTWGTQFFVLADEVMPKGTKWILKMWIKADEECTISTSAQATPRTWKGGFVEDFRITTEWKEYTWSGEIGVDDFQSIAFDLNNDGGNPGLAGNVFYFDNIEFGVDLGGSSPMNDITVTAGYDVVCVNFNGLSNVADLVKAAPGGGKTLFYDNSVASVTFNGQPSELVSVEARPDGNLYFFLLDDSYEDPETEEVKVAFTNPKDAEHQIVFKSGKFEGEPAPDFSGVIATFDGKYAEGEISSSMWGAAMIEKIEPVAGSFNLPADTKTFTVTFNVNVKPNTIVAKLGDEALTVSPAEGDAVKTVTLTRTAATPINGAVDLVISKVTSEKGYDLDDDLVVEYSFGPVDVENAGEIEVLIDPALFQDCANDQVPVGYYMNYNGEERLNGTGYSGGARMFEFAAGGDFTKGFYFREGYLVYGNQENYALALTAGKKYTIHFNSAMWKDNGAWMKFDIFTKDDFEAEGEPLYSEMIANTPNMNGAKGAVSASTDTNISFTPEEDGNYILRWTSTDANGSQAYSEVLLANVSMKFIPNLRGLEETMALNEALENAQSVREANNEERYAGEAFTALDNLIKEVEANKATYTDPAVYTAKAEELKAAAKAMADHTALCQEYDALPLKAFEVYTAKKEITKFTSTSEFTNLVATMKKYCTIGTEQIFDEETGEESTLETLDSFTLFYTDAELNAAKEELSNAITKAEKMLTVGESHNWYGGGDVTSGYAALHERLRRGVELLKSLGVAADEPEIVYAESILGDNDDAAEAIMKRAQAEIFKGLADPENDFFEGGDKTFDLSVFVKNPNVYCEAYSTETPGWTVVQGNAFGWSSWNGETNHTSSTPYPEDCKIHAGWHPQGNPTVEQTITNLPAGVYTIQFQNDDNNSPVSAGTLVYVKLSDTPAVGDGEELDPEFHYAAYADTNDGVVEGLEITDGILTLGRVFGPESQAFFDGIKGIILTAAADGHDYAKDITDNIETAASAKVRALQVYDLNGRRMIRAQKGLQIVKKQMSDGTIRVEKVIVK